ncbi:xanthine dehydrogenase family protein molybdopterin-binding subunit [Aurantivibrio infirmus]
MRATNSESYSDDIMNDIFAQAESEWAKQGAVGVNRRSFLKLAGIAGGGLTLAMSVGPMSLSADAESEALMKVNTYIRISPEGKIYIYSKNPEIGQGVKTSMPMIVAEELDAAWEDVVVEQSPIGREFGAQFAGGSRSIPSNWDALRQSGAAARAMLLAAAAKQWGVSVDTLRTEDSKVINGNGESLGYGELALAASKESVPETSSLKLKETSEFRLLGKRITGVDNNMLVTGQPLFGIDQQFPGMVYATYTKSPAFGAKAVSANLDEVKKMPGVKDAFILEGNGNQEQLASGVAIIANSTWAAFQAKQKLKVKWDQSGATDSWTGIVKQAQELAKQDGEDSVKESGDVAGAFASATKTVESLYTYQFASHANLEPQNCTAEFKDGQLTLWAPTQTPTSAIASVAAVTGLSADKITLNQLRIGGGFGRRLLNDYACEAAAIAQKVDGPVKVQWTREMDMAHDFYRPGGFHSFKAGLDADGKVSAWQNHFITFSNNGKRPVSGGSLRPTEFPGPNIENYKLTQTALPLGVPCYAWRAPGANCFGWVTQSFIHELSVAAGKDHRDFLIDLMEQKFDDNTGGLNAQRAVDVIKLATEKAGWGKTMPAGRALGLAFHYSHAGHIAEVAEVSVDANKKVTVHKVVLAADVGPIVNMSGAENQAQGGVVDGLSTMARLEITFEDGMVEQSNFHNYQPLRMRSTPEVESYFIQSDNSPTGLGEPTLPPLAPAVCNAIYAATGHRVKTLPLSKEGFTV